MLADRGRGASAVGQLGRSSANLSAVAAAVGASLGLLPACWPWPPLQPAPRLPAPGIIAPERAVTEPSQREPLGCQKCQGINQCRVVVASGTESVSQMKVASLSTASLILHKSHFAIVSFLF